MLFRWYFNVWPFEYDWSYKKNTCIFVLKCLFINKFPLDFSWEILNVKIDTSKFLDVSINYILFHIELISGKFNKAGGYSYKSFNHFDMPITQVSKNIDVSVFPCLSISTLS